MAEEKNSKGMSKLYTMMLVTHNKAVKIPQEFGEMYFSTCMKTPCGMITELGIDLEGHIMACADDLRDNDNPSDTYRLLLSRDAELHVTIPHQTRKGDRIVIQREEDTSYEWVN
ncbi:hypothetical protein GF345_01880 [Candidatus Woesearchaeota archaeon]|nr:hypothetical protein [Candidatus Woesearchaeota archaeon]